MNSTSLELVANELRNISDIDNPAFEEALRQAVLVRLPRILNDYDIDAALRVIVEDENTDLNDRYKALIAAVTLTRRSGNTDQAAAYIEKYSPVFSQMPSFAIHRAAHRKTSSRADYVSSERTLKIASLEPNATPGTLHAYADVVVRAEEAGIGLPSREKALEAAELAILGAIAVRPGYARYHHTYGRLLCVTKRSEEGVKEIQQAIALEPTEASDYVIRLNRYTATLIEARSSIQLTKLRSEFDAASDIILLAKKQMEENLNRVNSSFLQFIGFFAGVLGLIVSGVQIAIKYPPAEASLLMVSLSGALLIAFAGLSTTLLDNRFLKTLPCLLLGVVISGVALTAILYFKL